MDFNNLTDQQIAILVISFLCLAFLIWTVFFLSIDKDKNIEKKVTKKNIFPGVFAFVCTPGDNGSKSFGFTSSKALHVGSKIIETTSTGRVREEVVGAIQEEFVYGAIKIFIGGSSFVSSPSAVFNVDGKERMEAEKLEVGMKIDRQEISSIEKLKNPTKLRCFFIQGGKMVHGVVLEVGNAKITYYTSRSVPEKAKPEKIKKSSSSVRRPISSRSKNRRVSRRETIGNRR